MSYISEAALSITKQYQNLLNGIIAGIKSFDYSTDTNRDSVLIHPKSDSILGKADMSFYAYYNKRVDFNSIIVKSYNGFPYILAKVLFIPTEVRFVDRYSGYRGGTVGKDGAHELLDYIVSHSRVSGDFVNREAEKMGLKGVSVKDLPKTKIYKEMMEMIELLEGTTLTTYLHPKAIRAVKDREYIPLAWFVDIPIDGLCLNVPESPIWDYPLNSNKYRVMIAVNPVPDDSERSLRGPQKARRRSYSNYKDVGLMCMKYTPFRKWCIPNLDSLKNDIDINSTLSWLKNDRDF